MARNNENIPSLEDRVMKINSLFTEAAYVFPSMVPIVAAATGSLVDCAVDAINSKTGAVGNLVGVRPNNLDDVVNQMGNQ
ncbi:2899_t:CDS:1, partial [Acaulospora colombiana]